MDLIQMFPIYLNVFFYPHLNEAFLICPVSIEAVGPYPNALNLLKCF